MNIVGADIIRPMGTQCAPFGLTDEYLWNAEGGVPYTGDGYV